MEIFVPNKYKGRRAIDVSSPDVFMASNSTFPGIFECDKNMSSGIKFCPTASFVSASRLKKQSL